MKRLAALFGLSLLFSLQAETTELGGGFRDHGVASPASQRRGVFAARDGAWRNVVLIWLMDVRGGYAVLQVAAETGGSVQRPIPCPNTWDSPYTSIRAGNGRR